MLNKKEIPDYGDNTTIGGFNDLRKIKMRKKVFLRNRKST
jgi:hypothetical protein